MVVEVTVLAVLEAVAPAEENDGVSDVSDDDGTAIKEMDADATEGPRPR